MVVDYVSATATLEAGAKALGRRGRLVTLGGAGKPFQVSAADLLNKEQDVLGSRYVTRSEVLELLDLVARGEVFPLVTVVRPLEEAEAVHELVERGEVIGRAGMVARVGRAQHCIAFLVTASLHKAERYSSAVPPPERLAPKCSRCATQDSDENRHPRRLPGHGRSASMLLADPPPRREALSRAGARSRSNSSSG